VAYERDERNEPGLSKPPDAATRPTDRRARLVDTLARLALEPASPIRDKLRAFRLLSSFTSRG
jgi:hypothetical protein